MNWQMVAAMTPPVLVWFGLWLYAQRTEKRLRRAEQEMQTRRTRRDG